MQQVGIASSKNQRPNSISVTIRCAMSSAWETRTDMGVANEFLEKEDGAYFPMIAEEAQMHASAKMLEVIKDVLHARREHETSGLIADGSPARIKAPADISMFCPSRQALIHLVKPLNTSFIALAAAGYSSKTPQQRFKPERGTVLKRAPF
eukprot:4888269-Amphidinium_carterae.2